MNDTIEKVYEAPAAELADSIIDSYRVDHTPLFSFDGRMGRLSYLAWQLAGGAALFAVGVLCMGIGSSLALVIALAAIPVLALCFMIGAKRFHDMGHSGWWQLTMFIPVLGVIPMIYACVRPGEDGLNLYGAPRETRGWETIAGFVMVALYALGFLNELASL